MRYLGFALAGVIASLGCTSTRGLDFPGASPGADAAPADATPPLPSEVSDGAPLVTTDASSDVPARMPYRATAIALGRFHACARLDDGHVKCWGRNDEGQLGLGDTMARNDPSTLGDALPTVDLGTGRTAISIAAGRYTSCAALDDGSFKCWGWPGLTGTSGLHGPDPGGMGDALPALDLGAGRAVRQVAIGVYRAFGVLDDGSVVEWSSSPPAQYRPASASPAVIALTPSGGSATALFADGTLAFLEANAAGGPLGAERYLSVAANMPVRAIGGNDSSLCVALRARGLRCTNDSSLPAGAGASPSTFAAVATTGDSHLACGLRDDGQVVCWGGKPNPWWAAATSPPSGETGTLVALGQPSTALAGGYMDMCAVLVDGSVKCWSQGPSSTPGLAVAISVAGDWHDGPWLPVDLGTRSR